jgi:hypothetical protein
MRARLLLAALALAVAATPVISLTSSAESATQPVAKVKATDYRMLLTFDFKETLKAGTRVRDASRHKNGGIVVVQAGGKLLVAKGVRHHGANYPNKCAGCGRALIEIRDHKGLDPGLRSFNFGASLRLTKLQGASGSNVVQKGYFKQLGGQFKLQLDPGGIPSCVFYGSETRIKVTSSIGIANNNWHRVNCTRGKSGVTIRVDGKLRGAEAGVVGSIANAAPIRVGAKKIAAPNKQFRGVLDNVFLRFLPTS